MTVEEIIADTLHELECEGSEPVGHVDMAKAVVEALRLAGFRIIHARSMSEAS